MLKLLVLIITIIFTTNSYGQLIDARSPVFEVVQTEQGKIQLATAKGLLGYWGNQLHDLQNELLKQGIQARAVRSLILKDNKTELIIGTEANGIYWLNDYYQVKSHWLPGENITAMLQIAEEQFLIGTSTELVLINTSSKQQKTIQEGRYINHLSAYRDKVYIGTRKGLWVGDRDTLSFDKILNAEIWDMTTSKMGVVIFSNPYTYLIDNELNKKRLDSNDSKTYRHGSLTKSEDQIWLSANDYTLELRSFPEFESIPHHISRSQHQVNKLFTDQQGHLWIATSRGLEAYTSSGILQSPNTKPDNSSEIFIAGVVNDNRYLCYDYAVYEMDYSGNKKQLAYINPFLQVNKIFSCHINKETLYIGTLNGLIKVDINNDKARWLTLDQQDQSAIIAIKDGPTDNSLLIGTDNQGVLLIDTSNLSTPILRQFGNGEVNALDLVDENTISYVEKQKLIFTDLNNSEQKNYFINNLYSRILSVTINKNNAWLASYGDGVFKVDLLSGQVTQFQSAQGLPNNLVTHITVDTNNRIWVTTRSGLAYLEENSSHFSPFGETFFFSPGSFISINESLWLAGSGDGLISVDPSTVNNKLTESNSPRLHIDQVIQNGQLKLNNEPVIIAEGDQGLSISAFVSDALARGLTIEYQVPAINKQWMKTINNIISVPPQSFPGNYAMHLRIKEYPQSITKFHYEVSEPTLYPTLVAALSLIILLGTWFMIKLYHWRIEGVSILDTLQNQMGQLLRQRQKDHFEMAQTLRERVYKDLTDFRNRIRRMKRVRHDMEISQLLKGIDSLRSHIGAIEQDYCPKELRENGLAHALTAYISQYRELDGNISMSYDSLHHEDKLAWLQRACLHQALCFLITECQKLSMSLYISIDNNDHNMLITAYCDVSTLPPKVFDQFKYHLLATHNELIVSEHQITISIVPKKGRGR